jgi:hypothetical protein
MDEKLLLSELPQWRATEGKTLIKHVEYSSSRIDTQAFNHSHIDARVIEFESTECPTLPGR